MQRFILGKKNQITLILVILIAVAFFSKLALGYETVFFWILVVASVIGVAPIAIQAYQALRVKSS